MKSGLRLVAQQTEKHEREALRGLVEKRESLEGLRQQLDQLSAYRDEYKTRFEAGQQRTLGTLRHLRGFIGQIDDAAQHSHRQLRDGEDAHDAQLILCKRLKHRKEALENLLDRRQMEERRRASLRSMREIDEMIAARC